MGDRAIFLAESMSWPEAFVIAVVICGPSLAIVAMVWLVTRK